MNLLKMSYELQMQNELNIVYVYVRLRRLNGPAPKRCDQRSKTQLFPSHSAPVEQRKLRSNTNSSPARTANLTMMSLFINMF